jgi:hypothetical protein
VAYSVQYVDHATMESDMRTLLAIVIFAGGILTLGQPAEAAKKYKRSSERHYYGSHYYAPRYSREEVECDRARNADPTGAYRGYPCWAQEALSPRGGGTNRR